MPESSSPDIETLLQAGRDCLADSVLKMERQYPQQGTELYKLYKLTLALANEDFASGFSGRTEELKRALEALKQQAAAAQTEVKALNEGAKILQKIADGIGYLDKGIYLASRAVPLFAAAAPGAGRWVPGRHAYYGWSPDLPDHRDFLYAAIRPKAAKLPEKTDLRGQCPPVENQYSLGSCTANALVGALEFLQIKKKLRRMDLSRLFLYYNERAMEGTVAQDSGAQLRDGVKCLRKQGICSEDDWPYEISRYAERPPVSCYQKALDHQIISYHSIRAQDEALACLAEGYPFVFGFSVFSAFESDRVARTGVLNYPVAAEKPVGGHAVVAVGYDLKAKRFWVRNSWGADWGQEGYFTIPFAYLFGGAAQPALAADFWTIRSME